ncbi:MAG: hypothetical protein QW801_06235 [Candidatus Caldarchaeum sp.]
MLELDPTLSIMLIALAFLFFFTTGTVASRRRVAHLFKAVMEAVSTAGGKVVDGRRGTTTAVLSCRHMGELAEFSVVIGVQSWSNPLSYLVSKLMGRSDLAILRARTRKTPTASLTFVKKGTQAERYASRWGNKITEVDDYLIVSDEEEVPQEKVSTLIERIKGLQNVLLLSVGKRLPNLQVYFTPGDADGIKELLCVLEKLI